jgi:hypothetical protein
MKNYWITLVHQGALKLAEIITYSNGKKVTRVYNNPCDLTEFELLGE